jgi:hypothetical protein
MFRRCLNRATRRSFGMSGRRLSAARTPSHDLARRLRDARSDSASDDGLPAVVRRTRGGWVETISERCDLAIPSGAALSLSTCLILLSLTTRADRARRDRNPALLEDPLHVVSTAPTDPSRAPGVLPLRRLPGPGVRRLPGPEGFFDAKKPASFRLGPDSAASLPWPQQEVGGLTSLLGDDDGSPSAAGQKSGHVMGDDEIGRQGATQARNRSYGTEEQRSRLG